jgi:hypothetical protein
MTAELQATAKHENVNFNLEWKKNFPAADSFIRKMLPNCK